MVYDAPVKDPARRLTKAEVHYRGGTLGRNCAMCKMFKIGGRCSLVLGDIRASGDCDHFEVKRRR